MQRLILHNATIVTGRGTGTGSVIINGDRISSVVYGSGCPIQESAGGTERILEDGAGERDGFCEGTQIIDLRGRLLMAGGVDAHVHFREPGLTWKADIQSESRAALLGGVTSFIDMPNTVPPTTDMEALEAKATLAAGRSYANYGFHLGATADNFDVLASAVGCPGNDSPGISLPDSYGDQSEGCRSRFAGIKVFMGSSTGNMKVDGQDALERIFSLRGKTVSVHAENDGIIRRNLEAARARYGNAVPVALHPQIRSREACIDATARAIELALRHGTMLHVLHVSTAEEIDMISQAKRRIAANLRSGEAADHVGDTSPLAPRITAETSINYLWFSDEDYPRLGAAIKCNPAIKSQSDRARLIRALRDGEIDAIGSDHAPHLWSEKNGVKFNAGESANHTEKPIDYSDIPSGIPSIRFTLPVLLTIARREGIPLERIASAFSERPAEIFGIRDRGRIEPGCYADLVVIDPDAEWTVTEDCLAGRCGWSPYLGERLTGRIEAVILNGGFALGPTAGKTSINEETIVGPPLGKRIVFD